MNLRQIIDQLDAAALRRSRTRRASLRRVACMVLVGLIYRLIWGWQNCDPVRALIGATLGWTLTWLGEIALLIGRDRSPLEGA